MYVVDSIYSFSRFPALGSSFFQSLVFIVGFFSVIFSVIVFSVECV